MDKSGDHSVFEYLYRDAGNYKTHAQVLLRGRALDEDHAAIRRALDDGCFVPARVGLPSLHEQHWRDCGREFDEQLDHPLHEFTALRRARFLDIRTLTLHSTVAQLAARFTNALPGLYSNIYYLHVVDYPMTCPRCDSRSSWQDLPDGTERHTCNNPDCAVNFLACEDDDDICEARRLSDRG